MFGCLLFQTFSGGTGECTEGLVGHATLLDRRGRRNNGRRTLELLNTVFAYLSVFIWEILPVDVDPQSRQLGQLTARRIEEERK